MSQAWIQHTFSRRRFQTQSRATAIAILSVAILLILGSLYLSQVAAFAITNREIEDLIGRRDEIKQQNEQLIGEIASYRIVPRLYARAVEIGFRPATNEDIDYLVFVDYNPNRQASPYVAATQRYAEPTAPVYDETFGGWLRAQFDHFRRQFQTFGG